MGTFRFYPGLQGLFRAVQVVLYGTVRQVQDRLCGAKIFIQGNWFESRMRAITILECLDIIGVGTAKTVDHLVIIANNGDEFSISRDQAHDLIQGKIIILEFVYYDVAVLILSLFSNIFLKFQQVIGA